MLQRIRTGDSFLTKEFGPWKRPKSHLRVSWFHGHWIEACTLQNVHENNKSAFSLYGKDILSCCYRYCCWFKAVVDFVSFGLVWLNGECHFKHFLMSSVVTYAICREVFNKNNWKTATAKKKCSSKLDIRCNFYFKMTTLSYSNLNLRTIFTMSILRGDCMGYISAN